MRYWALLLASVAACYHAPTEHSGCEITCETSCPGDLTCQNGFCVGPGEVCKPTFMQVAPGTGFACALDDQASVWCWGSNQHHIIDPGMQTAFPLATRVDTAHAWTMIDAGGGHVCGLAGGQLYCWGGNAAGECGVDGGDVTAPTAVSVANGPTSWTSVAAGLGYTCAIGDGGLWCWGTNSYGELGDGDSNQTSIPTRIGISSDWVSVAAGDGHTCAINSAHELWCWGFCQYGQCGPGAVMFSQMTPANTGATAIAVAVGGQTTVFVTPSGALQGLGGNYYGELGDSTATATSAPVAVTSITGWTSVSSAERSYCGLVGTDAYCWGTAYSGGIGRGYWSDTPSTTGAGVFKVATGVSQVDVGLNNDIDPATMGDNVDLDLGCVLAGNDIECWGDNRYGQLAQGGAILAATPAPVSGNHHFSSLVVGANHGCGIENGALLCWGSTEFGAVSGTYYGNSGSKKPCVAAATPDEKLCDFAAPKAITLVTASDAVDAGLSHTCTLHAGIMTCWGDNVYGDLGSSAPAAPAARPVPGPGGVAWKSFLPSGRYGQCAVPTTPGTYCWGQAVSTMTAPTHEPALDDAIAIVAAGSANEFACVLDKNGMLSCIGDNSKGQYGNGNNVSQAVLTPVGLTYSALSAYGYGDTVCAIAGSDTHVECWGDNTRGATGATDVMNPTLSPNPIAGLSGCNALAVGAQHACALCGGTVSCWGDNRYGQLGTDTTGALVGTAPTKVDLPDLAGDSWASVATGGYFTCARSMTGVTYCWGIDGHGGMGAGATSANLPVTVIAQPAL